MGNAWVTMQLIFQTFSLPDNADENERANSQELGPSTVWGNQGEWSEVGLSNAHVPPAATSPLATGSHCPLHRELSFFNFF